jgi:hypothetical protein
VDGVGRNDYEMASLINIGVQAKQEIIDTFAQNPSVSEKLKEILKKPKYRDLFGPQKRLIDIITGLRPDKPLTEDSLAFDPVQMTKWVNQGEQKPKELFKKSPFS